MQNQRNARRSRGTGSLFERDGAYYGKWRAGNRQVSGGSVLSARPEREKV
jgi:hypothetical protein